MIIQEDFSLKNYNTFHFDVSTKYFAAPNNQDELIELLKSNICKNNDYLILGGGSNILFKDNFNGLIIRPDINFISVLESSENSIWVEAGSGIEWDHFVEWCVTNNYFGIENLSLIPGSVGACPVQNIGAYGVEVKDVITQVNGIYLDTLEAFSLKNEECHFDYRNSIFKENLKGKIIITSVVFELKKQAKLNLRYGDVMQKVHELGEINLQNIRKAIIQIREAKLPDPELTGNVGSFFKNPVLGNDMAQKILSQYPDAPHYIVDENYIKIPAGWLIEKCDWKGKSLGNVAVHENQALVLINKTGSATGKEILKLADLIEKSVLDKFGIQLEKEVNVI